MSALYRVPVSWQEAQDFVIGHHRTHPDPPPGHKFCTGVAADRELVGVAIVGRPVAKAYQDGLTLEVTRTCTDGTRNANSMLYAAAWDGTKGMGYQRLVTYTQAGESGASLRAAGWKVVAERKARRGWDTPSRRRENKNANIARTLWEAS